MLKLQDVFYNEYEHAISPEQKEETSEQVPANFEGRTSRLSFCISTAITWAQAMELKERADECARSHRTGLVITSGSFLMARRRPTRLISDSTIVAAEPPSFLRRDAKISPRADCTSINPAIAFFQNSHAVAMDDADTLDLRESGAIEHFVDVRDRPLRRAGR